MSVGAVFVQRPGGLVGGGGHRHVVNDGHPHAGVGLEAEDDYGGTDEEHRDNSDSLKWQRVQSLDSSELVR